MKSIISIIKTAIKSIEKNSAISRSVVILWVLYLLKYVFNMITPLVKSYLLDGAIDTYESGKFEYKLIIGFLGIVITGIFTYIHQKNLRPIYRKTVGIMEMNINSNIYRKLTRVPYSLFNAPDIHEKIDIISDRYASYCSNFVVGTTLSSLIGTIMAFVFTAIILIRVNPVIAIIMICGNLFGIFKTWLEAHLNYYVIVENMKDRRYAGAYRSILFDRNTIKEVKLFGLTNYIKNKWFNHTVKVNNKTIKYNLLFLMLDFATYLVSNAFLIAALILTARLIIRVDVSVGAFMLVYSSSTSIMDSSGSLFQSIRDIKMAKYYDDIYNEIMNIKDAEPDSNTVIKDLPNIDICFKNVDFSYEGSDHKAINNLTLTIKQGEKVAIVGANGSGKSTLISLINRLYVPDNGDIYINNIPLENQMITIRQGISTVFQDFGQYETTFRNNISMGNISTDLTDSELMKYARKVGIADRITESEKGLDTPIGRYEDNGINLSGGEWQKLSIARSLANNKAKVIILDEPNAALDPISESEIYRQVFNEIKGNDKTLILITHRLGAIKNVNRIIVMNDGHIEEDGSHEELIAKNGLYAHMYSAQAAWYEDK